MATPQRSPPDRALATPRCAPGIERCTRSSGRARRGAACGSIKEASAMREPDRSAADELSALVWPLDALGEALVMLARHLGLLAAVAAAPRHPPASDPAALDAWLAAAG